jgi:hypothetical protein
MSRATSVGSTATATIGLTGVLVLVAEVNVTPAMRLRDVPEIGQYGDDLLTRKRLPNHLPQEVGEFLVLGVGVNTDLL